MYDLYAHQERVFELLMQGKNVILQAPTGSGKTRAALTPFYETCGNPNYNFPQRCIYSVPMRILANQFHYEANKIAQSLNRRYKTDISVAIQTGDNPQSREFTHNLIFATIDQTLSSFLMAPYGLAHRHANMNAGALLSSYLVFDEFHLYDPITTLPTTLYMLKQLKGIVPFMLMTATFSKTMLDELADELDAVVVPEDEKAMTEILKIPSQQKNRRYHTTEDRLSAELILNKHQGRTLVICNTVARAQYIYEQLNQNKTDDVDVILLHSRFLSKDRKSIEDHIRELFKEKNKDGNYIVVSTQAIEVGVDITSTVLHTELAPANAIIQRAGRCARYTGEHGDVYIYRYVTNPNPKPEDETDVLDLIEKVLPYQRQEDVFRKTWEQFEIYSGSVFDYQKELAVVTYAHADVDRLQMGQLKAGEFPHSKEIQAVQDTSDKSHAKALIRDIFQLNVIIHADPPQTFGRELLDIESISLYPYTLFGYINYWQDQSMLHDDVDWIVKIVVENPDESDNQANDEERYLVKTLSDLSEAIGAVLVIVHPNYASYSPIEGFIPNQGGGESMPLAHKTPSDNKDKRPIYKGYKKETYEEHIRLVYQAFEEQWDDVAWGAQQMECKFGWEQGSIRHVAELAVLLHDVGKLSIGWQTWAHRYQQALYEHSDSSDNQPDSSEAYAHTDFDYSEEQRTIQRSIKPPRPWHAVEGALAVSEMLDDLFGESQPDLFQAVYSAIARHHAPTSASHGGFRLHKETIRHIQATLPVHHQDLDLSLLFGIDETIDKGEKADEDLALPENIKAFLVYCLLVRALRRADQQGTQRGSEGI